MNKREQELFCAFFE
jgi:hypothetical protein